MTCVRLMNRNYSITGDLLANRFVSSEDASFPIENLDDIYRRAKGWRTSGYFNIVSGSNTIVFRESVGVDLTATVVVDEYGSHSDFLNAVKTALDAAGDSTYTVSRDSTSKKFVIVSNGSGGGGIFQPRWATSTAMAAIMGFDSVNLTGALTYTADDIANHTEEFITWDMGVPLNPTDFVAASLRNGFLNLSPSATIKLQGNPTNSWATPEFEQVLDFDDRLIYEHSATGLHTNPLRYWRFFIQDIRNPAGYVEFTLSFLGTSEDLDRGCVRFPFRNQGIDRSVVTVSEAGNTFSDKRPKLQRISLDWNGLTKEDRQDLYEIFEDKGISEPFFVSCDPHEAFSTSKESWVKYVKFDSEPNDELVSPNNFAMSMTLKEEL